MSDLTQEELVRLAHHFYPRGFPPEEDDLSEPTPAHQRAPEHQRFMAAWEQALHWEKWGTFMDMLRARFPEHVIGGGTQPFVSACFRCQIYRAESLARVPLPGIRIGQLNHLSSDPPPTLLDALFSDDLANLP